MKPDAKSIRNEHDLEPPTDRTRVFAHLGENVIAQFSKALRPDNDEGVHDLRVAIRRLRTAMSNISTGLKMKRSRTLDGELRTIAALAGTVRDHDVAIEVLVKLNAETQEPSVVEGLAAMIASRHERREKDLHLLAEHLSSKRAEQLGELIRELTAAATSGDEPDTEIGRSVVRKRRKKFLELASALYDPTDVTGHHRLRMAAKRLRYSAELFLPVADGAEPSASDRMAAMQDHLGNMHDCDLWIKALRKNLKKHDKSGDEITPDFLAAEWLLGRFVRRRANNYRSALELWAEWRSAGFLESIGN